MKNLMIVVVASVAAVFTGCAGNKAVSNGTVASTWTDASDATTLRFRGLGVPSATASSSTQKMGLAREAAQANARTQAVAYLKGIAVKGDVHVADLMLKRSDVHELVDRTISGLVEEQVKWLDDGGCLVVMSIDRKLVDRMIAQTQAFDAPGASTADVH